MDEERNDDGDAHRRSEFRVLICSPKVKEKNLLATVGDRDALAFG